METKRPGSKLLLQETQLARKLFRIVFFGTAEFAVPALVALGNAGHKILAVATQPDKPQGRGQRLVASPVKEAAEKAGYTVLQPRRVRAETFIARMVEFSPDILVVAAFGQVIPEALLNLPPCGPINVHGSLLPRYRGAAPIQRAVMNGESETGITTMWMDATLDTGDILCVKRIPIEPTDTSGTLIPRLAEVGAQLLIETLDGLAAGTVQRIPQDNALATFAPAVLPEDGKIRWEENALAIRNLVRGVNPKPGAFARLKDKRVKVYRTETMPTLDESGDPGTIIAISKKPPGVVVACGGRTALLLQEVQPENSKRMAASDWARGIHLVPGEKFE